MNISATCERCGRHAYDDAYFSTLPTGETLYWLSLCEHEYEPGDEITCDCGTVCPHCFTPEELADQVDSTDNGNSTTAYDGILFIRPDAALADEAMKVPLSNSDGFATVSRCCYDTVLQYSWYQRPDKYIATRLPTGLLYMHDLVVSLHEKLPNGSLGRHIAQN